MSDGIPTPSPTLPARGRESADASRRERQQYGLPVLRSPINALHQKLGAQLEVLDGWEVARRYRDPQGERDAIRNGLGLADITARGKIDVRGRVEGALSSLMATRAATLARVSRDWALVLTPAARLSSSLHLVTDTADEMAMVTDATSIYAGIALLGPSVDDLLLRLITVDPSSLLPGDCLATPVLRVPAILLRRALAVPVVEMYLPSEYGRYAWDAVFDVARPLHPLPVGWEALAAEGWR